MFVREDLVAAREEHLRRLRDAGVPFYPTWRGRTHTAADVHANVRDLLAEKSEVTVAGRLTSKRKHGGSTFLDLRDGSGKIQVLVKRDAVGGERYVLLDALDIGDIIAATGAVQQTKAGEDTVEASSWTLLTKSLTPLPDTWSGLQDVETRARQRELDLLTNESSRKTFLMRSAVVQALREFLVRKGFVEVETPILQLLAGGAAARPFVTHHHALDLDLFLRVAPELYLKRLLVGNIERVFEIGRAFRNEGVDRQHNPEFTMCEFYMAYATIDDLIPLTEEMFTTILTTMKGGTACDYQGKRIDFAAPWKQISFIDALRDATGIDVLREHEPEPYLSSMEEHHIAVPDVRTVPVLIDTLYKGVIRKQIWEPTIIRDFPVVMAPLAKRYDDRPDVVQKMQLLACGMEFINAYTELNDPVDQERRFREQETFREAGDEEAQQVDRQFLEALRIGLPPAAGWGLGVDRLTMLLTDSPHVRDVIAFPLLRPEQ